MADLFKSSGVIEVRIRELAQLFNSLDPSPFHERDLDQTPKNIYSVGHASYLRTFPLESLFTFLKAKPVMLPSLDSPPP